MAMITKKPFARIESTFWSALVTVMDSSSIARKLTPPGYRILQRMSEVSWIYISLGLATSGLILGFAAGMLVAWYGY